MSLWIGHSITVSGRHYANNVPDELFDRISGLRNGNAISAHHNAHMKLHETVGNGQKQKRAVGKVGSTGPLLLILCSVRPRTGYNKKISASPGRVVPSRAPGSPKSLLCQAQRHRSPDSRDMLTYLVLSTCCLLALCLSSCLSLDQKNVARSPYRNGSRQTNDSALERSP